MALNYDQLNKIKEKHKKEIEARDTEINNLKETVTKLQSENDKLRKDLFDVGAGKGHINSLKQQLNAKERENKTLENKIKDMDGSKLIATFSKERQTLIKRIRGLEFKNSIYNSLARKFKDGLDNVIEIASRIKEKKIDDMDYFTFVFRDDIVGLLEKMFKVLINKAEASASKYLIKLRDNVYQLPKDYYDRIPNLKDKNVINNILCLINLESVGYHGSNMKVNHLVTNKDTNEKENPNKFLTIDNSSQLTAIFTLLEFMYDVFTNKNHEINLLAISSSWFKTI